MMEYYRTDSYDCRRSIGYLLKRASLLSRGFLEEAFAAADISFSQWVVLLQLRDGQAQTASDLVRNLGHDSGAITRLLDTLEQRGLIERQRCREDRRAFKLHLTPAGQDLARALAPIAVDFYNTVLEGFEPAEVDSLIALLTKFIAHLDAVEYPPKAGTVAGAGS